MWQERYILYHMQRDCKVHRFTWALYSTPTQPLEIVIVKMKVLCVMLKVPNLKITLASFVLSLQVLDILVMPVIVIKVMVIYNSPECHDHFLSCGVTSVLKWLRTLTCYARNK